MLLRTWKIVIFWSLCIVIGAVTWTKTAELNHSKQNHVAYEWRIMQVTAVVDNPSWYQWFINGKAVKGLVTSASTQHAFAIVDTKNMARKEIHARQALTAQQPWVEPFRGLKRVARFAEEHLVAYRQLAHAADIPVFDNRRSRVTLRKSLFSVYVSIS